MCIVCFNLFLHQSWPYLENYADPRMLLLRVEQELKVGNRQRRQRNSSRLHPRRRMGMLSEEMPADYTGVSRRERGSSRTDKLSGLKRLQSSPREPVGYRVVLILFWSYIITQRRKETRKKKNVVIFFFYIVDTGNDLFENDAVLGTRAVLI